MSLSATGKLTRILQDQGRLEEAVTTVRRIVELAPSFVQGHLRLGNALFEQGSAEEAIHCYHEALKIEPDNVHGHSNLGFALTKIDRLEEAIDCLNAAIERSPQSASLHANLGVALSRQGNLESAITEYRTAIQLSPDHALSYGNLGLSLKKKGQLKEAIACFERQAKLDPNNVYVHSGLAWDLATLEDTSLRNPHKAIAYGRRAVELEPDRANHWSNLGVAHYRNGDWQESVNAFKEAHSLAKSGDLYHRFFLAMAYWKLQEEPKVRLCYREALAYWHEKKRTSKQLQDFRDEAEELLGIKLDEREQVLTECKDILVGHYTEVVQKFPENWQAFRSIGDLFREAKQWAKAIDDYSNVIRLNGNEADAYRDRYTCYREIGE